MKWGKEWCRRGGGTLVTGLNYSLLPWFLLCKILEMADVETLNNRATPAKNIPNSLINRSAVSERTRGTLPRRLPIRSSSSAIFPF